MTAEVRSRDSPYSTWENEINPVGEGCDGPFRGRRAEYNVQIGVGPDSILKIIERLGKLLKEEEKTSN